MGKIHSISVAQKDTSAQSSHRPWLDNLGKPWWLKNDLHHDVWHVYENRDDKKGKTKAIYWRELIYDGITETTSYLTDPQNFHLLETAQLYVYYVRQSDLLKDLGSLSHHRKANAVKTIIVWMALNGINKFSEVNRYDFKKFAFDGTQGVAGFLDIYSRLDRLYKNIREQSGKFPLRDIQFSGDPDGVCNDKLSNLLGFNTHRISNDSLWQYMLVNYSNSLGHRIKSCSRKHLEREEPEPNKNSPGGLRNYLVVWQDLFILREHFNDKLKINLLKHENPTNLAESIFKENGLAYEEGRTETIPAYQLAFLVDRALRWVLLYADEVLDLRDEFERTIAEARKKRVNLHAADELARERFGDFLKKYTPKNFIPDHPDYPAAPWPVAPLKADTGSGYDILSIGKAITKFIPIACAIVIATFTAKRHDEILSARDSGPNEHDDAPPAIEINEEGAWFWCYHAKTVQDWDRVPCPTSVVKAIEVLTRWSEVAREPRKDGTRDRRLFRVKAIGSDQVYDLALGRHLNDFADFIGVPHCDDGVPFKFKPHQFRRFFAIIYMHRYEHANLSALSHQLRHESYHMTETYATELRDGELVSAAKKEHALEVITEVALGKRTATGPAGEKLDEMLSSQLKRALKDVEIIPERLSARIARQIAQRVMDKLDMSIVPFKYGYCIAFKKLKFANAACLPDQKTSDGPDLTKAEVSRCAACPHFYVDQTFRFYWENMAEIYSNCLNHEDLPEVYRNRANDMLNVFANGLETFDWSIGGVNVEAPKQPA